MKVVINRKYGGFQVSPEQLLIYRELAGIPNHVNLSCYDIERTDPFLIQAVEQTLEKEGTTFSKLKIVEIPDDIEWDVQDYDGCEWIAERHRTWY
jgi:hypothetical protein